MAAHGNPTQWDGGYPSKERIKQDWTEGNLYVIAEGESILGVFVFIIGEEKNYSKIEGSWKSRRLYGTIHRIASSGLEKGIFEQCLKFCLGQIDHLRIDTHRDNSIMRHLIEKSGFEACGTIYVEDGSPRIAYELIN